MLSIYKRSLTCLLFDAIHFSISFTINRDYSTQLMAEHLSPQRFITIYTIFKNMNKVCKKGGHDRARLFNRDSLIIKMRGLRKWLVKGTKNSYVCAMRRGSIFFFAIENRSRRI